MPDGPAIIREELADGLVRWSTKAHTAVLTYVTADQRPFEARAVYLPGLPHPDFPPAEGVEIVNADGKRRAVSLWYYDTLTATREEAPVEINTP